MEMERPKPRVKARRARVSPQPPEPLDDGLGPPPPVPSLHSGGQSRPLTNSQVAAAVRAMPVVENHEIGATVPAEEEEVPQPETSAAPEEKAEEEESPVPSSSHQPVDEVSIHDPPPPYELIENSQPPSEASARTESMIAPRVAVELPPPLPPRQVYPNLVEELTEKGEKPKQPAVAPPRTAAVHAPVATASVYPRVEEPMEYLNEREILTEGSIMSYYQNPHLGFLDGFVDQFVAEELHGRYCLFELLAKLKAACEVLERSATAKGMTVTQVTKINNEVWLVSDHVVTETGRCGDDRQASGSVSHKIASFVAEKIVELKDKLDEMTKRELDEVFCQEIRARSLSLQIQWTILMINADFLIDIRAGAASPPSLIQPSLVTTPRKTIRGAISDLFHFLRYPQLPKRFSDQVWPWIVELSAALFRGCTTDDQLYLLCHLMRTPSPLVPWAALLVHTFIAVPTLDLLRAVNSFVSLLSLAVKPVKARELFLANVIQFQDTDESWNVISDDCDMDETKLSEFNENDIVAILGQFDVKKLLSTAIEHFSNVSKGNKMQVMMSLIGFSLTLTKICDEGLVTFGSFKNGSKKLASFIRLTVCTLCQYWDVVRHEVHFQADQRRIQNEVNRVVITALSCIVGKKGKGLWQFIVGFPYKLVTECCRQRCQLLIRQPEKYNAEGVFGIADENLNSAIKATGNLGSCVSDVSNEDTTYMMSALAAIVSQSDTEMGYAIDEIVRVCFLDESHRENLYKVGSEAVAVLIDRAPKLLTVILNFIDRNIDHIDQYATDILAHADLSECVLSTDDVDRKLAKWLVTKPPTHAANITARKVLSVVNWTSATSLWMPQEVHDAAANIIVKAHVMHCKARNDAMVKSYVKAAKLLTACSKAELQFDHFCFDVLVKIKFLSKAITTESQKDVCGHFVYLNEKCLSSVEVFLTHGLQPFCGLVNSYSIKLAVVFLARLIAAFPSKVPVLIQNETFRDAVHNLLHADDSSYITQILTGGSEFPGPAVKSLIAAMTYDIVHPHIGTSRDVGIAWLQLLTCKKATEWNADKAVVFLVGVVVQCAFEMDPNGLFSAVDIVTDLYRRQLSAWRESSKGILSWLSTPVPPPLLTAGLETTSLWFSFVALQAEAKAHSGLYDALYAGIKKHPDRPLEEALKKAASKAHINLVTVDRLSHYRWMNLCVTADARHQVYPLLCQQLAIEMLGRQKVDGKHVICPGAVYFADPTTKNLLQQFTNAILPGAENEVDDRNLSAFYHALPQWFFHPEIYRPTFSAFTSVSLDHLAQMVTSGDRHLWLDLVDLDSLRRSLDRNSAAYVALCHLERLSLSPGKSTTGLPFNSLQDFTSHLQTADAEARVVPVPAVPIHEGLPTADMMTIADASNPAMVMSRFGSHLDELTKATRAYVDCKERVSELDVKYLEEFSKLYNEKRETLILQLACGNVFSKCQRPVARQVTVQTWTYNTEVADVMNRNRQQREEAISRLIVSLEYTALRSASLEFICRALFLHGLSTKTSFRHQYDLVRKTGTSVFFRICESVSAVNLMFPAAVGAFETCLHTLGSAFVANHPDEQKRLMQVTLNQNPFNHMIYGYFTPHCLPAQELFNVYSDLSKFVRRQATSTSALELLRRLNIEDAGRHMPQNQFSALMPIIYENLTSANGTNAALASLCSEHFVHALFHHAPANFVDGYALLLSGIESQAIPIDLFDVIARRLDIPPTFPDDAHYFRSRTILSPDVVTRTVEAIGVQLTRSRQSLGPRFYPVWSPYIERIIFFAEYLIRVFVAFTFDSNRTHSVVENELIVCFQQATIMWAPFLEPLPTGLPPWNPADGGSAAAVVERFIKLLMWLPHSVCLPPDAESVESLFWKYFVERLVMPLQIAGTKHVFEVYEEKLILLKWQRFWPNLHSLDALNRISTERLSEIGLLVTEIFVRIPWRQIISFQHGEPPDAHRSFQSLMLSLIARCVHSKANYARSRASMDRLLAELASLCRWDCVKVEILTGLGDFVADKFPADSVKTGDNVVKGFFNIWRNACCFSTAAARSDGKAGGLPFDAPIKQAAYIRTDLRLALRAGWGLQDLEKHYRELLGTVNVLTVENDISMYVPLAKELTAFLKRVTKERNRTALIKVLSTWLISHAESPLILLIMNTVYDALGDTSPQLPLKLLNKCIAAYFGRRLNMSWAEVARWMVVPPKGVEFVYSTPSTDAGIKPRFLVLNALLMQEMPTLRSADQEAKMLGRVMDYLSSIKPKYITAKKEAGFVLCLDKLQHMVIRQYAIGIAVPKANVILEAYLVLLKKIFTDEKGGLFNLFSKKVSYSTKLQVVAQVMYHYGCQQQTTNDTKPRLETGQGVLNGRVQAFNDLQTSKQYAEHTPALRFVGVYFTNVSAYNLSHAGQLFATVAKALYPENDKLLSGMSGA